jgi:acetyl esterase/lipase
MLKILSLLLLTLGVNACTATSLAVVNLPAHLDDNKIIRDVAFGSVPEQKLDIYIPANLANKKTDVIVFLYGGRWSYGTKEDYAFVGDSFANQGFIAVIPDYRKYPAVRFPIFVEDSAKALAWVQDHIAAYRGHPDHIILIGHSAGAHIGALIATDSRYLAAEGKNRSDVISGFIGLAGPYAFTPDEPDLKDMFGPPSSYTQMQATTFVDGRQPAMLLLHGQDDKTVQLSNLNQLEAITRQKGGYVQSIIYPNTSHVDILADLTWIGNSDAPVRQDIKNFIAGIDAGRITQPKLQ